MAAPLSGVAMRRTILTLALLAFAPFAVAVEPDARTYELRVYTPNEGKQAATNALIAGAGVKAMTRNGIELLGAWTPADAKDDRVITLVGHAPKSDAAKNWAAFSADEGWKADLAAASKDGKAVKSFVRFTLNATDYSPAIKPASVGNRLFELRTYVATPNNLKHLNARFRDHTVKLFETHGMTNVAYFNIPAADPVTNGQLLKACSAAGKDAADCKLDDAASPTALVYFLTHKDADAMKASFGKFGQDPKWKSALTGSEKTAGGPLTAKNGVKSLLLKATEYSPMK
jgi:hypothetical protein